jgi:type VI secretion system secreted protein Hcp
MAVDLFLKIDGIEGESKDSKHPHEIELTSFSFGATQTGSFSAMGGGGSGKVRMGDFNFTVPTQISNPKFLHACATGLHIPQAVLTCRKAGKEQQEFLKYTFGDLLVSGFQIVGGSGNSNDPLVEQVSVNFAKIQVEYKEQKADGTLGGSVKAGYDLKQMKEI